MSTASADMQSMESRYDALFGAAGVVSGAADMAARAPLGERGEGVFATGETNEDGEVWVSWSTVSVCRA